MLFRSHPYTKSLMASIPIPDPEKEKKRQKSVQELKGEAVAAGISKGCPFAPRCRWADEKCFKEKPALREVGQGHFSACFNEQLLEENDEK